MKRSIWIVTLAVLAIANASHAELHELLKPQADCFNKGMQSYEETRKARIDLDRKGYLAALNTTKKRYERLKKTEQVAVIDAEIKAANAGAVTGDPPAGLPEELHPFRQEYIDAPASAAQAIASVQKFSRESYLRTLAGLMDVAKIGNSAELEADVTAEKRRVLADLKAAAAETGDATAPKAKNPVDKSKEK